MTIKRTQVFSLQAKSFILLAPWLDYFYIADKAVIIQLSLVLLLGSHECPPAIGESSCNQHPAQALDSMVCHNPRGLIN